MSDEIAKKKDELLRVLSDVESQARNLERLGQNIIGSARFSRDIAGPIREFVFQMPDHRLLPDQLDRQIEGWRAWQRSAGQIELARTEVNSFSALTFANTSTSTGIVSVVAATPPWEPGLQTVIENTRAQLDKTLERFPLIDEARSSMRRLGLDSRRGKYRPPLELLEEAKAALEIPAINESSPVSVLITFRECVNAVIAELLRRRAVQESTPNIREKVISLGRRCGSPDLDEAYFERLAADADALLNELSGVKQTAMSRLELSACFHRGVAFLVGLMKSIDEKRLRPA